MLGRFRPVVASALVLLLGCRPTDAGPPRAAEGSQPVSQPDPRPIIDAAGAPPSSADEPTAEAAADDRGTASAAEPAAPRVAPGDVGGAINQPYHERRNPKRWAAQFEREGREVFDRRDDILDALALREGMAVADVGAGTGLFTLALAERVGPKGKVYAVDVQAYFLDHIGQKARKAELRNVELVKATQASAELPEGSVDLVIMCDAYHHVERPAEYLASLHAALRPGGRLVIVDYIAIEGQSKAWVLDHVRATPEQFRAEIEGEGFRFLRAHEGLLEDNFFYELERP